MSIPNFLPRLLLVTASLAAVLLHLNTHLGLESHRYHREVQFADEDPLPSAGQIEATSINYTTAAADLIWLGAIFYTAERDEVRQPPRKITDYADALVGLDPTFHPIYFHHYAVRYDLMVNPNIEDRDEATRLLRTGLEYFPEDWKLAQAYALSFLGRRFDRDPDERVRDLESAVEYAERGADSPDAPPMMTGLAISLRRRLERARAEASGEDEIDQETTPDEIDFLVRRYLSANDERQKRQIEGKLRQAGAASQMLELTAKFEDKFRDAHHRGYPYLHPDLFTLVDANLYRWDRAGESMSLNLFENRAGDHEQ